MSAPRVKKNAYHCVKGRIGDGCGAYTITVDLDDGVTPFFHKCKNCGQLAQSLMYRLPPLLEAVTPHEEWYRPTATELAQMSPAMQEHCAKGGLAVRPFAVKR